MSDDRVRLTVNTKTCIGSGLCEMMEAEVFYIDDDSGIASVIGDQLLPPDRADMVIEGCPSGAISLAANPAEPDRDAPTKSDRETE